MRTLILFLLIQLCAATFTHANGLDPNKILTDKSTVFLAQVNLNILGYDPGPTDSIMGNKTKRALAAFQRHVSLPRTEILDEVTEDTLAWAAAGERKLVRYGTSSEQMFSIARPSCTTLIQYS